MPSNSLLHFIANVINFEGFKATNYHFISEEELLIVVENQSRLSTCPHCQKTTDKIHQSHWYRVRDLPWSNFKIFLQVNRRQFRCKSCQTIRRWLEEILGYFDERTTQGIVEGINQKIKLIKRRAFGLRNFNNFRRRLLLSWHFCS